MNIDTFLQHHGIRQNPFVAEEARLDPVFQLLLDRQPQHPDFPKILGQIDQPATSIVFGEKGSGKTAIRMHMARRIAEHNQQNPDRRVLAVNYDDLNPMLDRLMRTRQQNTQHVLDELRLEDHQDAILGRAVTRFVDGLLGVNTDAPMAMAMPEDLKRRLRRLPRQERVDLAVIASLYDQPHSGTFQSRWQRLRKRLKLGAGMGTPTIWLGAMVLTIAAVGLGAAQWWLHGDEREPIWLLPAVAMATGGAVCLWGWWLWRQWKLLRLSQKVRKQMPVTGRSAADLRRAWRDLSQRELLRQPLPTSQDNAAAKTAGGEAGKDARYQMTRRFVELLRSFGYVGIIVMLDRVDEPTLISGDPDRMIAVTKPMFDNKFLQQDGLGLKLLLPIELRHWVHRETGKFFQHARLDKQNLIDRLTWSGPTLYDLCSARMTACLAPGSETQLSDLFEPGVGRGALIDALDQMHQPRDAFKFLYAVIQEHCRLVSDEQAEFRIARLTLDTVRRHQTDRLQDLYRGLGPA